MEFIASRKNDFSFFCLKNLKVYVTRISPSISLFVQGLEKTFSAKNRWSSRSNQKYPLLHSSFLRLHQEHSVWIPWRQIVGVANLSMPFHCRLGWEWTEKKWGPVPRKCQRSCLGSGPSPPRPVFEKRDNWQGRGVLSEQQRWHSTKLLPEAKNKRHHFFEAIKKSTIHKILKWNLLLQGKTTSRFFAWKI